MDSIFGSGESGYAYALGLVSGLHGKLLAGQDYDSMLEAEDVAGVLSRLDGTVYGPDVRELKAGYSLQDVEEALACHFRRNYIDVAGALPAEERELFDSLMLGGWDIRNLKTVVRGLRAKVAADELTQMFFPTGTITAENLAALTGLEDVKQIQFKLPQPYRQMFEEASIKADPAEFEETLDRLFIRHLMGKTKGGIRDYIGLMVDALNIRIIIRCRLHDLEPSPHVLRGGFHISENQLSELLRQDMQGIMRVLENTPYSSAVKDSMSTTGGGLVSLDARLEAVMIREVVYRAMERPLTVNPSLAYLKRKESEVGRLRVIIAGKWHGMSPLQIRRILE